MHRTKLHSNNSIERLNGEIKRATEVVGIFLNKTALSARAALNAMTAGMPPDRICCILRSLGAPRI